MFYSKTTGGFYDFDIHGTAMPDDVVEISKSEYLALLEGQSSGKLISADVNCRPVLTDHPAPTPEQLQLTKNAEARAYLASTDWYVVRLQETGTPIPADISAARQAARDSVVEV